MRDNLVFVIFVLRNEGRCFKSSIYLYCDIFVYTSGNISNILFFKFIISYHQYKILNDLITFQLYMYSIEKTYLLENFSNIFRKIYFIKRTRYKIVMI